MLDHKFKSGDIHFGVPAFSPSEYVPTNEEKNSVVVVTVGKKEYYEEIFEEIFDCLNRLGFRNIILAHDIYEFYLPHTPRELEKEGFGYYLDHRDQILACLDLFSDDLSRQIFICFIQMHMQRKPIQIPAQSLEEQYFPKDIKLNKGYFTLYKLRSL